MINKENILTLPEVALSNINYAFFTNEDGHSDAGYLIDDKKTRNVNIFSSGQSEGKGFDPAARVLDNIQMCFHELAGGNAISHKFYMTSYYANGGKSEPLIVSCDNLEYLLSLKQQASSNLYYDDPDKSNPNRLGLDPTMIDELSRTDVSVIRADSLVFKGISGESIAVLGASGDAHPIMMFDDANKISAYISGAHSAIKQGVLEKTYARMLSMGANPANIKVVIGPGLGPLSYEFGENAPEYFNVQKADTLKPVADAQGNNKYLINIKNLVCEKLTDQVDAENIYDINLDSMGFNLYNQTVKSDGSELLERRTAIDFTELDKSGLTLFGARRSMMSISEDLMEQNSAAHNTVGRHAAGFVVKP